MSYSTGSWWSNQFISTASLSKGENSMITRGMIIPEKWLLDWSQSWLKLLVVLIDVLVSFMTQRDQVAIGIRKMFVIYFCYKENYQGCTRNFLLRMIILPCMIPGNFWRESVMFLFMPWNSSIGLPSGAKPKRYIESWVF